MLVVKFHTASFRVFPYVQVCIRDVLFSQKSQCTRVVHFCIYPATTTSPSFWVNGQPQNNSRNKCGRAKVSPQTILGQQQFINMSCLCTLPNHQLLLVHNYLWIFHCDGSLQCMHVHVYAILL